MIWVVGLGIWGRVVFCFVFQQLFLFFFLMLNEILSGKMPHEMSQTIHSVLRAIRIYGSSPHSCLLSGPLHPQHSCPQVIFAGFSSHPSLEVTGKVGRAADPGGGGSGAV